NFQLIRAITVHAPSPAVAPRVAIALQEMSHGFADACRFSLVRAYSSTEQTRKLQWTRRRLPAFGGLLLQVGGDDRRTAVDFPGVALHAGVDINRVPGRFRPVGRDVELAAADLVLVVVHRGDDAISRLGRILSGDVDAHVQPVVGHHGTAGFDCGDVRGGRIHELVDRV